MENSEIKEDVLQKLNRPKFIDIAIISGITAIVISVAFYLFPDDTTKFEIKAIVCLIIMLIGLILSLINQVIKFHRFYIDYEIQYNYLISKLNIDNNITNKKIKKIEKNIKNIKDKQDDAIYYETVGEIDETTGEIIYYDKPKKSKKL